MLIVLIVASLAAIIYVSQFGYEDKKDTVKAPKPAEKETAAPRAVLPPAPGKQPEKNITTSPRSAAKKEKAVIAKIEKFPAASGQVAIIVDDIGHDLAALRELLKIDAGITFAVLPLLHHSRDAAEIINKAGREALLHLPMEPSSYPREKPGSGALFTDMNNKELLYQLEKNLASVPHISGVNNHMGSKFMEDKERLTLVFSALKKRNLFFIDSRTTAKSAAAAASAKVGLPMASRHIFLDNSRNYKEIYQILMDAAARAEKGNNQPLIIIGHPYPDTIRALRDAMKVFREKNIQVVPVSRVFQVKTEKGDS